MKHALIALLAVLSPIVTFAQKNNLYADAGISLAYDNPGFSITDNYKLVKWFGVGIGFQDYNFSPTFTNRHEFVPTVLGDIRFYIRPRKKSQFFMFLDPGIDFYTHNDKYDRVGNIVYTITGNNGFYTGLGFGYFHRVTKRGGGLYTSVKLITNSSKTNQYNVISQHQRTSTWTEGTAVLSVGFKF